MSANVRRGLLSTVRARVVLFLLALAQLCVLAPLDMRAAGPASVRFNGTNARVRFATVSAMTALTVETWVKRTTATGGYETFVSNASSGYGNVTFGVYIDGGNSDCGNNPPAQFAWAYTTGSGFFTQCSGVSASLNVWYHVAVTRDASKTARIFVDGVLRATAGNTASPQTSTGALGAGNAGDAQTEYFPGLLDELRVSNVARYTATFSRPTANFASDANTVALYHFDEGSGTTTAGSPGASGTLTNVTWSTDVPYAGGADTAPPVISGVTSGSISSTGATITWSTDEPATSQVEYGTTTSYGSSTALDASLLATHSQTLVGLAANTLYNYRVISRDAAGNQSSSANATFTTQSGNVSPPAITNLTSGSLTLNSAAISWTTDVVADSRVEYGPKTAYGSLTPLDPTLVTSHGVTLTGLSSNQLYHYRVQSRGQNGILATSPDATFTTPAPSSSTQGQWSSVMNWPLVAVHSSLLPSGDVVMWDAWETPGTPSGRLWSPTTQAFTSVPVPMSALFCAGQTYLADARPFVIGGHHGAEVGIPDTNAFEPSTQAWQPLATMNYSRWYPTAVALGDGRMLALGGEITPGVYADTPEVYNPATNVWTPLSGAPQPLGEYPSSFLAPDGKVFILAGTDLKSRKLDIGTQTWTTLGTSPVPSGTAAMYRGGKVVATGGGDPVQKGTAVIDLNQANPTWRSTAPMAYQRVQHNLVLLPDSKVLAVGGSIETSLVSTRGTLPAEMWDPVTETWTTMASMHDLRMYHSTALLLLDGRVLVAGGGRVSPAVDYLTAEIYSPPYLFKGPRPTMTSAPGTINYGATMAIQTPDQADITSVSLIRLPSVTHTHEMSARFLDVAFTHRTGGLDLQMPASVNMAPPGYYMLFILNSAGVPSVASVVKLGGAAPPDTQAPTATMTVPSDGAALASTVSIAADATDNVGVSSVQFLLDGAPLGTLLSGTPYTMLWDTTTTTNGSHTLAARALDAAGNVGASIPIAVSITNPSGLPTATATVTPSTVTQGGSASLNWSTTNATSVTIDQGIGPVAAAGSRSVNPPQTTTYTVTAANVFGSATAAAILTVNIPPPLPTASLSVSPGTITAGGSATLSWATTDATTVTINNGIGAVSTSGSRSVSPATTTTYTMTATNSTGSAAATATLVVNVPPPTASLSVSPATITAGSSATLSWTTTNAASITIDQGIGAVTATGSRPVNPTATTTYTLTATNSAGTNTSTAMLTVNPAPPASGTALNFNGTNSRARFTRMPAMTVFTVEAWVKRRTATGGHETFISNANAGYSRETFGLYVDGENSDCGSSPAAQWAFAYTAPSSGWFTQCSGVGANLNVWHHVAVTRDSANATRMFLDGVLVATKTATPAPSTSNGALGIGEAADAVAEYFPGEIDELRISSIVRYTANFTPSTSNFAADASTVALYHFDETAGQTIADASGNARNGVLGASSSVETADPTRASDSPVR